MNVCNINIYRLLGFDNTAVCIIMWLKKASKCDNFLPVWFWCYNALHQNWDLSGGRLLQQDDSGCWVLITQLFALKCDTFVVPVVLALHQNWDVSGGQLLKQLRLFTGDFLQNRYTGCWGLKRKLFDRNVNYWDGFTIGLDTGRSFLGETDHFISSYKQTFPYISHTCKCRCN